MKKISYNSKLYLKSDYLLACLRKVFSTPKEMYAKWSLLKYAFNGSYLITSTCNIEIIFFTPDVNFQSIVLPFTTIDLGDMVILIYDGSHTYPWIENVLQKESNEFNRKYPDSDIPNNKVSRLVGSLIVSDFYIKDCKNLLLDTFDDYSVSWFDLNINEYNQFETDPKTAYLDIIIDFDSGIEEKELSSPLRKIFVDYEPPILGWGYNCINHSGGYCVSDELKWAHLVGRHF